ncbi:hypothetical protein V1525DRAFT_284321 [Lipomyces kononenkoae]|uniref:Uncharacterized protein n=1 Tax=Lipomyces kononenkoae TaxID=34357 RepID=A0ACC3SUS2_LIPKO
MTAPDREHHAFIGTILHDRFDFRHDSFVVRTIEQAKNNYVYLIELANPTTDSLLSESSKPFTSPIPANTSRLIFRIPKANVSLEDSVRVRNEVAFLALGRDVFSSIDTSLVPRVFAWEDNTSLGPGFRWILEEWKDGETLTAENVEALNDEMQRFVLDQLAAVVKSFHKYSLPDSVRGFGGLSFDEHGILSNTASTIPCGGPFPTYSSFLKGMCKWQIEASERSTHLNGWKNVPKLRKRLDNLFASGLDQLLVEVPEQRPTLVHADLCKCIHIVYDGRKYLISASGFPNMLFDISTYRFDGCIGFRLFPHRVARLRVSLLLLGHERASDGKCRANGTNAEVAIKRLSQTHRCKVQTCTLMG